MRKKIFVSLLLGMAAASVANGSFGPLTMAWVGTFSPGAGGYQNGWKEWETTYKERNAVEFRSAFSSLLQTRNPSGSYPASEFSGSQLSSASFNTAYAPAHNYELVAIVTHGNVEGALGEWAQTSTTDKTKNIMWANNHGSSDPSKFIYFSGWNRWAFLYACHAMKNWEGYRNCSGLGTVNEACGPVIWTKWADASMRGVHALFGFEEAVYQFDNSYRTGPWYDPHRNLQHGDYQSWRLYDRVAANWISSGQPIWDAFRDAAVLTQYTQGGVGTVPSCIYRYGQLYGQYATPQLFDGSKETVGNVYNGAVLVRPGDAAYNNGSASEVLQPVPGQDVYQQVRYQIGNPDLSTATWYGLNYI